MFDPDTFMQTAVNESNSTSLEPIPVGEYKAVIDEIKIETREGKDGKPVYPLEVTWQLIDDELSARLGRDKLTVRQTIWLDLNEHGTLDTSKGKNVGLGKLREALGMNAAGKAFSISNLRGAGPALVSISQSPSKNDPEVIYSNVKSVGRLS